MDREPIDIIIGRILTNKPKEGDQELLEIWISEAESNRQLFILMKESWEKTQIRVEHPNADKLYQSLQNKISTQVQKHRSVSGWVYGIAASVVVLLTFLFLLSEMETNVDRVEAPLVETIRKENPFGQKSRIHLPDGSTVSLNSGSSIEYTSGFYGSERVVRLSGEAFFEVKKISNKPFKVIANRVVTTALGTSFDVRAFPESEKVYVSLLSGKVRVENLESPTLEKVWKSSLNPGEQLVYHVEKQLTSKGSFDTREMVDWKDGVIYFKNTDLHQVVTKLERWFGVSINLKDIPSEVPEFSGEFKNESLDNILKAMSYSGKIKYTIEHKNIIIECINS